MRRRLVTAAVAAILAAAAACAGAGPAAGLTTGLGEQNTAVFDDPAFVSMRIDHVRIVVPWDAALTNDGRAAAWIERALARGLTPLVTFEKSRGVVCPGSACAGPSVAAYEAGIAAFRARWPTITQLTPWNEPNHKSQPTYHRPALAADYYDAARRVCAQCRLVAGDVLDDGNLRSWVGEYQRALDETPALWGLHNYYDATYFDSRGLDTLSALTSGEIWLTETGGIVRFSPPGGGGLPHDEERAADSLRWLYALTASRPRVTRMYVYHWQGLENTDFDGGLVGPHGQARPGLAVVREHAGLRSAAGAPLGGRLPVLRVSGKALRLVKRGLRVGVACVSAPKRCTGRLSVTTPRGPRTTYRPRLRMNFTLRPGRGVVRLLPASRRARRALLRHRRLQVTYCLG
ncbi:MAG: hypothetical protein H0W96_08480, partial [Solirubrobacterales bacterium]|nr:hypothetical protein [Solirubrobacterales bacterium]